MLRNLWSRSISRRSSCLLGNGNNSSTVHGSLTSSFSSSASPSSLLNERPRIRIVHFSDVYELRNLPRLQTLLSLLSTSSSQTPYSKPQAVTLGGDFLSPSTLASIDGGKGMVQTLRAVGITHAMLGNHEADLALPKLQKRIYELCGESATSRASDCTFVNTNVGVVSSLSSLPASPSWLLQNPCVPYSFVNSECGRVQIALLGLMSDEISTFRDGTFRGLPIRNICDSTLEIYQQLCCQPSQSPLVNALVPMTHQTMVRDKELAQFMLDNQMGTSIILGAHEHEPAHETVTSSEQSTIQIVKGRYDAQAVNLIDIEFQHPDEITAEIDDDGRAALSKVVSVNTQLIELENNDEFYPPSSIVSHVVDSHMAIIKCLENEDILDASLFLPPGVPLCSVGTRYKQTTVGGVFCMAMKEELEADACIINGSAIKGNTLYSPKPTMSYAQLKKELPFPTKMIVVKMKRWQLQDAIHYSRTHVPKNAAKIPNDTISSNVNGNRRGLHPDDDDQEQVPEFQIERKGFLQVDAEFDRIGFHTGDQNDELLVALPRNLLKGFCKIKPLMDLGEQLKAEKEKESISTEDEDDYVLAIDLVIRHFSKERWYDTIVEEKLSFSDLDKDHKGFLSRKDVRRMLRHRIGHEPPEFVIDDMMAVVDADENGVIDQGEFSHLLAQIEREHGPMRFDL